MTASQNTAADYVHISGTRGQMLRVAIFGGVERGLCGASLEDDGPPGTPVKGVCRACAKKAKWTEAEIAEADAFWSAS